MQPRLYFQSILTWWSGAWAVAVAGPLALWLPSLQPPWPEGSAVIVGVMFGIVGLAIARAVVPPFETSRTTKRHLSWLRWTAGLSFGTTLIMCVAYLFSYSMYVVADARRDGSEETPIRRVIGSELIHAQDANIKPEVLLAESEFDETRVWTRPSLTRTRLVVLLSYALIFFFLCLGLGFLAILERPVKESAANGKRVSNEIG